MMLASCALLPELVDADPSLDGLFITIPFFGPTGSIDPLGQPESNSRLHLVWPGGLWDWLDPVNLVDAEPRICEDGRRCVAAPAAQSSGCPVLDPRTCSTRGHARCRAGRALDIVDAIEIVDWVPHAQRRERLTTTHAAVTLDRGGVEAHYAFRTRLVDALAAGIPVIATSGEYVADARPAEVAGSTCSPNDPDALAALLLSLTAEPARLAAARERAPAIAADWAYERTVAPLATWCRAPRRAGAGAPGPMRPALRRAFELRERVRRSVRR